VRIEESIRFLEEIASEENQVGLASERSKWIRAGREAHNSFWKHLKRKTQLSCV
jgi:hypothetical protein